jgi:UPF0755 protein
MSNPVKAGVYKRRRRLVAVAILLIIAAIFGYSNRAAVRSAWDIFMGRDYTGNGTGLATLVIKPGESGLAVASDLEKLGVVKNADVVYRLIVSEGTVFYPGTYQMNVQMSSPAALRLLADPKARIVDHVTIKEGLRIGNVLKQLSEATGKPLSEFQSAASDLGALGIPTSAPNADGYLFPATYDFNPDDSAQAILKQMVDRAYQELDHFGVAVADRHRVLTLASIIQKEARQSADFYKVSRVFANRLKIGMKLQSDATVSYGSGGTTVSTTNAERANPNGYNTYVHDGLPIGPIGGPGSLAIDAALHPAAGSWLYFCAINLKTGETVFSTTAAEHAVAVAKWRAWMAAYPGWNGN